MHVHIFSAVINLLTKTQQTHENERNEPVQCAARIAACRSAAAAARRRRLVQLVVVLVVQDGPRHLVVVVRHDCGDTEWQSTEQSKAQ